MYVDRGKGPDNLNRNIRLKGGKEMKYYYTVINGWEDEGEISEINLERFDELLSDARDGFYRRKPLYDNDWYVVHHPSPRQELNGVVYQDIVSSAGGSFHVKKMRLNRTPCEFVVIYSPPQELNGVVFEESKTIVIAKKS